MLRRMTASDRPVLIAYDGSPAARQAVADAADILRSRRAVVVTVWEAGLAYVGSAMPSDGMMMGPAIDPAVALGVDREVHRRAEHISADGAALAKSLGFDAEPLAVSDDRNIAETILNVARSRNVAAIVVGSRGLGGLRARLEGSTSKNLLKHAHVPVIVVHETEHEVRPE